MNHYQIKAVICLMTLSITACAHQSEENNSLSKSLEPIRPEATSISGETETNSTTPAGETQKETGIMMSSDIKNPDLYFQKQPNTSVYDLEGKVVRTLRSQSFVPIFLIENERAFINRGMTQWVNLSTLTAEQPEKQSLPKGSLSNGLETLDRGAIKEAIENGRK